MPTTITSPAASPAKQLTHFVTFYIKPLEVDTWLSAHRPVWDLCAKEPQCLYFDVFQDPDRLGKFRLVKIWHESHAWFEKEQLTKPYYETLWEKSKPMWRKEGEIQYWECFGEGCSFKEDFRGMGIEWARSG